MYRCLVVLFSALVFITLKSYAIVTDDLATSESDPGTIAAYSAFDWTGIYRHPDGSGVAVDQYWLLTAAHAADYGGNGAITAGSTTYLQQEIVYSDADADLALIRYDKAFPVYYSLFSGDLTPHGSTLLEGILVGYGNTGTVSTAAWSDSAAGRNTRRWGSQAIDREQTVIYNAGGVMGETTNSGFWMDFDLNDTDYEAGVGVYDSGGGMLVNDGDEWKLAGINTFRSGTTGSYTATFSIAVQDYSDWITETVPEPSMAVFLCFSGLLFILRKKFLRHRNR
jgi:hypothetical protein